MSSFPTPPRMSPTPTSDLAAVAEALRAHDRFLLVTHENPDGDALGSILGGEAGARPARQGQRHVPRRRRTSPPTEYAFLALDDLRRELPDDAAERVLVALDCANAQRMGAAAELLERVPLSIDVDHHHDNTRFGADQPRRRGRVVDRRDRRATCSRELDVTLTPAIAEALYVALVTDTGRFQYTNTTPKALRLAAELVEAGVDVQRVFQGIYESVEFAKLKLLARALERAQVYEGGRLVVSYLLRSDFHELGVGEEYAEGIIDYLRAVDGAEMAAMIREPPEPPDARAPDQPARVERRARRVGDRAASAAGGGHRQAAGFSSAESVEEIVAFIRSAFAAAHASESA